MNVFILSVGGPVAFTCLLAICLAWKSERMHRHTALSFIGMYAALSTICLAIPLGAYASMEASLPAGMMVGGAFLFFLVVSTVFTRHAIRRLRSA